MSNTCVASKKNLSLIWLGMSGNCEDQLWALYTLTNVFGWVHWGGEVSKASIERGNAFNQPRSYDWWVFFSFFNIWTRFRSSHPSLFHKRTCWFPLVGWSGVKIREFTEMMKIPMKLHPSWIHDQLSCQFSCYFCNCLGLPPTWWPKVVIPVARARCCCGGHRMWRGPCHSQRSGYWRGPKIADLGAHINGIWCFVIYFFNQKRISRYSSIFGLHFLFLYDFKDGFCIAWLHDLCFFSLKVLTNSFHLWSLHQDAVDGSGKGSLLVRLNPVHCKAPDCRFHMVSLLERNL